MKLGKSIRVYLKEGTVTGIKLAEVVNLTIQAISCPRNKLAELNQYFSKEANRPGIYFLLGTDEENNNPKVYIGEAENVWERLKNHDIKKDFWSEVILFTSKDDNLTKSHVKYLESRIINIAQSTERYVIENTNSPNLNSLPLPDKDAMEEFILNLKLLIGTLGHKFLENSTFIEKSDKNITENKKTDSGRIVNSQDNIELELNIKGLKAKAIQTDEGIVVLKNSQVSEKVSDNFSYKTLRDKLISEKIIRKNDKNELVFAKNYLFKSPSAAAAVIAGYSRNGRKTWKDKKGKTLKELEEEIVKDDDNMFDSLN